jgi:hypothetical protein
MLIVSDVAMPILNGIEAAYQFEIPSDTEKAAFSGRVLLAVTVPLRLPPLHASPRCRGSEGRMHAGPPPELAYETPSIHRQCTKALFCRKLIGLLVERIFRTQNSALKVLSCRTANSALSHDSKLVCARTLEICSRKPLSRHLTFEFKTFN